MSRSDFPPMGDEVERLLDVERAPRTFPPAMRGRVLARLQQSIAAGAAVELGEGPPSIPVAPAAAGASKLTVAAVAFALGGLTGAGVLEWLRPAPEPPAAPAVAAPAPVPVPPAAQPLPEPVVPSPAPPRPAARELTARDRTPKPAPASSEARTRDDLLSAERMAIETARNALARGRTDEALSALERHERDFSAGQFQEEREALRVQALVGAGRVTEARDRAEAFRGRFPDSLLWPVIENALSAGRD